MNLKIYAHSHLQAARRALARSWRHITIRNVIGALIEFVKVSTSDTFWAYLMAPFATWALLLMYELAHYPDRVVKSVAAGPGIAVHLWVVFAPLWLAFTLMGQHYRRAAGIGLAMAALLVLDLQLPPIASTQCQTDAQANPSPPATL